MMACLNLHLGVVWILFSIVVIGLAAKCNNKQVENNAGRCCDLCPPGEYMKESKEICSDSQKTVCVPCEKGYYSKGYSPNPCVQCSTCEHDYEGNCTPTTNAACKCRPGFLCSNNVCSNCLQQQCSKGEQLKRHGQVDYRYTCEPCPDNTYSDTNDGKCKTLTQCSAIGMMIEFAGNKSHNAICQIFVKAGDPTRDPTKVVLTVGFVAIAFTLLIFLIHAYIKNINRKHRDKKCHAANRVMMSPAGSHHEYSLSKEESGGQSIHQAESSDDDSEALSLKHITVC